MAFQLITLPLPLRVLSPASVQFRLSLDTSPCDRIKQPYQTDRIKTLLKTNLRAAHTYTGRVYACTENRRRQKVLGLKEFLHCCCFALHHQRKWCKSQHWSNITLVPGFQLSAISLTCKLDELLISHALSFEGFILFLLRKHLLNIYFCFNSSKGNASATCHVICSSAKIIIRNNYSVASSHGVSRVKRNISPCNKYNGVYTDVQRGRESCYLRGKHQQG